MPKPNIHHKAPMIAGAFVFLLLFGFNYYLTAVQYGLLWIPIPVFLGDVFTAAGYAFAAWLALTIARLIELAIIKFTNWSNQHDV